MSQRSIRAVSLSLSLAMAVITFAVVQYLLASFRGRDVGSLLNRPISDVSKRTVTLQVALHDLVEAAGAPATIRVCLALANRPVTLRVVSPQPMSAVLESLARQVGAEVVLAVEHPGERGVATIRCPGDLPGDYLTIGRGPQVRRSGRPQRSLRLMSGASLRIRH